MYPLLIGAEPRQCEEVPVSGGAEEECLQNGDGGLGAETKPEEEHGSNGSASSPSEGQQ